MLCNIFKLEIGYRKDHIENLIKQIKTNKQKKTEII